MTARSSAANCHSRIPLALSLTVIARSCDVTIPPSPILFPPSVIAFHCINSSAARMAPSAWQLAAATTVMGSSPR